MMTRDIIERERKRELFGRGTLRKRRVRDLKGIEFQVSAHPA